MKQPLVKVSLAYLAGLVTAYFAPLPLAWLFALSGALALGCLAWAGARPLLLWPWLLLLGWTNLTWRTTVLAPDDLRRLVGESPELAELRGVLAETPSQRITLRRQQEWWHSVALVDVCALGRRGNWQPASGRVVISTPGVLGPLFFGGQRVEVSGVLQPPKGPVAEGLFNYRAYLKWLGVYHQLKADGTNDWRLAADAPPWTRPPLTDRLFNWAQATLAKGLPGEDEPLRLLWAMTLGWRTALTNEVSEPWMHTGTMHIFAISGLQIALIAGILVSLLRVLQMPRGACGWVAIPALWFCAAVTGWQSSAIRSTLMMSIVIAGWALRRPSVLLNSLAAAGFILLLWDPRQLFQASFQLSFFVVLSMALLIPVFDKFRERVLAPDPLLPEPLRPKRPWWVAAPARFLATSLATSLAAWLGSVPLIAFYFHLLTPISLLANLVIVPLSSLALMCNLGSLVCGGWLTPLTVLFNHSGWFWMDLMIQLNDWLAVVPGAYWYVRTPTAAEFIIYYGLVFGAMTGWFFAHRRWLRVGVALGLLAGWWAANAYSARQEVRLTVLALGGGDAIFIDTPGRRHDLLVDTGNAAAAGYVVKPFLGAQGINHLPRCLLTHGDLRHVGGAPEVSKEFGSPEMLISPARFRSPAYRRLVNDWDKYHQKWKRINRGDRVGFWTVLHPAPGGRTVAADDSVVVLRGEIQGLRLLLCSDLSRAGQRTLLDQGRDLKADVVISGIPSRNEPLEEAFLDAVKPRFIILSCANSPANEQAKGPLRQRLERRGVPVIYTSDAGSVTLTLRPHARELRTMSGQRWALHL